MGGGSAEGGGGDDQLKETCSIENDIKSPNEGTGRGGLWFPNQTLTSEVRVQGEEFFQKGFLRRGHQQSQ